MLNQNRTAASPNALFEAANRALAEGRADDAQQALERLDPALRRHGAVLQLEAGIARLRGDWPRAAALLDEALAAASRAGQPADPSLLMNRALAAERAGDADGARRFAARATELAQATWPIWQARLDLLHRLDGPQAGDALLDHLLEASGRDPFVVHQYCLFALASDRLDKAATLADELVERSGDDQARLLQATIAERAGRPAAAALARLDPAARGDRETARTQASALLHEQGAGAALDHVEQLIRRWPDWADGRDLFARLAWQAGEGERADAMFAERARAAPDDEDNLRQHLQYLANTAGPEAAHASAPARVAAASGRAGLRVLAMSLASEAGALREADALAELLGDGPFDEPTTIALVRHAIRRGALDRARAWAEPLAIERRSNEAWTYVWSLWRACGDPRLGWLEQDGRLWGTSALAGFETLADPLAERLRSLHARFRTHPYEQSPRGGTQTAGPLLARPDPELAALRAMASAAVRDFIDRLPPPDPAHPVLSRPRHQFAFSGSWSIRLTGAGFHKPHYHSQGWLSSALYVTVPDTVGEGDAGGEAGGGSPGTAGDSPHGGWLTLGVPPADLGLDLPPIGRVRPAPGRLALFPSILWHGTEPFAAGERMTVAFDITPLPY